MYLLFNSVLLICIQYLRGAEVEKECADAILNADLADSDIEINTALTGIDAWKPFASTILEETKDPKVKKWFAAYLKEQGKNKSPSQDSSEKVCHSINCLLANLFSVR